MSKTEIQITSQQLGLIRRELRSVVSEHVETLERWGREFDDGDFDEVDVDQYIEDFDERALNHHFDDYEWYDTAPVRAELTATVHVLKDLKRVVPGDEITLKVVM